MHLAEPYAYEPQARDADGDPIRFGTTAAPGGMTIDAVTGRIEWAPTQDQVGPHDVTSRRPTGGEASPRSRSSLKSSRAAQPRPHIVSSAPAAALANRDFVYTVRAVDGDGDPLRYGLQDGPAGLALMAHRSDDLVRRQPANTASRCASRTAAAASRCSSSRST